MKYNLYQESRKGGRPSNQDRLGHAYTADAICMVLADGMGGHAKGEVAAQFLVDAVLGMFRRMAKPTLDDITEFLLDGIYTAHEAINEFALKNKLKDSPRTTCVVCVVQHGRAWWAHVGDSRLYHFGRDGLISRTRDHSAVQHLVDEGLVREDEINTHPERNKLYNSVGGFVLPNIELSPGVKLGEGDVLMLSSDGFWAEFMPDELMATLRVYSIRQAVQQLMEHAEFRAGERGDNLSVIALRCGEDLVTQRGDEPEAFGLDGFTTELKELAQHTSHHPTMSDHDIDQAIEEIREALLKHKPEK
ncbi:MAG: PP2C family protein-serine/threonine phosphatase [Pseudomonadota bacterium]